MLNRLGNENPAVLAVLIEGADRRRKIAVGKCSHRNSDDLRLHVNGVPDCRTAVRAKAKTDLPTGVTHPAASLNLGSLTANGGPTKTIALGAANGSEVRCRKLRRSIGLRASSIISR